MEKVRVYVRKNSYLKNPKNPEGHVSIDGKHEISPEILNLEEIASKNISKFINGKKSNAEIGKLVSVYVTQEEKIEAAKIENKTIKEIQIMIFQKMSVLSCESQELQEEIYQKTVKNKTKEKHITFYQVLCELEEKEFVENVEDNVEEEDNLKE